MADFFAPPPSNTFGSSSTRQIPPQSPLAPTSGPGFVPMMPPPPSGFGDDDASATMHQRRTSAPPTISNPPTVMVSALPSHVRERSGGSGPNSTSTPTISTTNTTNAATGGGSAFANANNNLMQRQHSQGVGIAFEPMSPGATASSHSRPAQQYNNSNNNSTMMGSTSSGFGGGGGGDSMFGGSISGTTSLDGTSSGLANEDDDLPLLEELGIRPDHILTKTKLVLNPFSAVTSSHEVCMDEDLAGPLTFALCLGFLLTLQGKIHFGAIYGMSISGILLSYFLLSMMSTQVPVRLSLVISTLGYCLLPDLVLAFFATVHLWIFGRAAGAGFLLTVFCFVTVCWSAWCSMKIFAEAFNLHHVRYLILYPAFLLYAVFAAITMF